MTVALIILAAVVVVGAVLRLLHKPDDVGAAKVTNGRLTPADESSEPAECCGMHIICERDSLLPAVSDEIVYYDDEELDAYRGIGSSDYTPEAIEEFRDVLLSLLPNDIAGWARSLQLRGIELPAPVRDELLMVVAEARKR